jgi:hypothetical protein
MQSSVYQGFNYFLNFLAFLAFAFSALALSDLEIFGFLALGFFKRLGSSFLGENPGKTWRLIGLPM